MAGSSAAGARIMGITRMPQDTLDKAMLPLPRSSDFQRHPKCLRHPKYVHDAEYLRHPEYLCHPKYLRRAEYLRHPREGEGPEITWANHDHHHSTVRRAYNFPQVPKLWTSSC